MHPVTDEEIATALRGAPHWITPNVMREALDVWQPYYAERLSADDALGILIEVGQLFELLSEKKKP